MRIIIRFLHQSSTFKLIIHPLVTLHCCSPSTRSYLARRPSGLQEALVDGVLEERLVLVGRGGVPAASAVPVVARHLEHGRAHLEEGRG